MAQGLSTFMPAGGLGSRLRPHTLEVPKPLLLMGASDRRIIDGALELVSSISDHTYVSVSYHGDQVESYLDVRADVTALRDVADSGSGGSLIEHLGKITRQVDDGDLLIVPSDHIYDGNFSIESYLERHRDSGADVTLLTVPHKKYGEYVAVNNEGVVDSVETKVDGNNVSTTGTYMFRLEFLWEMIRRLEKAPSGNLNIYTDIVCPSASRGRVVSHFIPSQDGFWEDTGTLERFLNSNMRLSRGQNVISEQAQVNEEASLVRCVVLSNAVLGREVELKDSIISCSQSGELFVSSL